MPEKHNADATLERDTNSYIWVYKHQQFTFVKQNKPKNLVSCESAILLIHPSSMMPSI
jgi:hypothetical protein